VIVATLKISTNPANRSEILRNLTSLLGRVRVQPGCTACHLYEDVEEPKVVLLAEEWSSRAEMDNHLRSDDYRRILTTIELSDGPPELHFDEVSSRGGLELVESVRLHGSSTHNP
jgi:quinol monooxygenase YgiN